MKEDVVARILQMSDLLIGSEAFTGAIEDKLMTRLTEETKSKGRFHYMLFCGNVSANGQEESFKEVAKLLRVMATDHLMGGLRGLNRIMIVPGYFDVRLHEFSEPDYTGFKTFYDSFFGKSAEAFDHRKAILRELRGMTLVGACYYNLRYQGRRRIGDVSKSDLEGDMPLDRLSKVVAHAADQACNVAYCNSTPTLLVTADSPVTTWETRAHLADLSSLKRNLEEQLKLDLHLFGSGDATCLPFEPFTFQHVGLSTGPRHPGELWPLRMNVVEIDSGAVKQSDLGQAPFRGKPGGYCLAVKAWQLLNKDKGWIPGDIISGELDCRFTKYYHIHQKYTLLHSGLIKQLEPKLEEDYNGIYLVRGLPGSGLDKLFRGSNGHHKVGRSRVRVIRRSWDNYAHAKKKIDHAFNEAKKAMKEADEEKIIVVLSDLAFRRDLVSDKVRLFSSTTEGLLEIQDYIELFLDLPAVFVLYVLNASDDLESSRLPRKELRIGALDPDSYKILIDSYGTKIPLDEARLTDLTGCYAGFSLDIITCAKQKFRKTRWMSELITIESVRELMDSAVADRYKGLLDPSYELIKLIEKRPRGAEVVDFVRALAFEMIEEYGSTANKDTTVHAVHDAYAFTEADIIRDITNDFDSVEADRISISETLRFLAEYDLLEEVGNAYRLQVPVPFLLGPKTQERRIFISHPRSLTSKAVELVKALSVFVKPRPQLFDRGLEAVKTASLTGSHQRPLRASNNLIVLFEDRPFDERFTRRPNESRIYEGASHESPWVESEVNYWIDCWKKQWGDVGFVPLVFGKSRDCPLNLYAAPIIRVENRSMRALSRTIFGRLVPPAELRLQDAMTDEVERKEIQEGPGES